MSVLVSEEEVSLLSLDSVSSSTSSPEIETVVLPSSSVTTLVVVFSFFSFSITFSFFSSFLVSFSFLASFSFLVSFLVSLSSSKFSNLLLYSFIIFSNALSNPEIVKLAFLSKLKFIFESLDKFILTAVDVNDVGSFTSCLSSLGLEDLVCSFLLSKLISFPSFALFSLSLSDSICASTSFLVSKLISVPIFDLFILSLSDSICALTSFFSSLIFLFTNSVWLSGFNGFLSAGTTISPSCINATCVSGTHGVPWS